METLPLHRAIDNKSMEEVLALLDGVTDLDVVDDRGRSPLHLAADWSVEAVQVLLKAGANASVADIAGDTALHVVACSIDMSSAPGAKAMAIQALVDAGADVNAPGFNELQPLMIASTYSNVEAVRALLAAGANVNARWRYGETPLHMGLDDVQVVEALLENCADLNALTKTGETPLDLAEF